jgi:hypothetical protein
MARKYFVMLERDGADAPWFLSFGAYVREDVVSEIADRRDHGVRASNLLIRWSFAKRQADLDLLVARENGKVATIGARSVLVGGSVAAALIGLASASASAATVNTATLAGEPTSASLLLLGFGGLAFAARRRRQAPRLALAHDSEVPDAISRPGLTLLGDDLAIGKLTRRDHVTAGVIATTAVALLIGTAALWYGVAGGQDEARAAAPSSYVISGK